MVELCPYAGCTNNNPDSIAFYTYCKPRSEVAMKIMTIKHCQDYDNCGVYHMLKEKEAKECQY